MNSENETPSSSASQVSYSSPPAAVRQRFGYYYARNLLCAMIVCSTMSCVRSFMLRLQRRGHFRAVTYHTCKSSYRLFSLFELRGCIFDMSGSLPIEHIICAMHVISWSWLCAALASEPVCKDQGRPIPLGEYLTCVSSQSTRFFMFDLDRFLTQNATLPIV